MKHRHCISCYYWCNILFQQVDLERLPLNEIAKIREFLQNTTQILFVCKQLVFLWGGKSSTFNLVWVSGSWSSCRSITSELLAPWQFLFGWFKSRLKTFSQVSDIIVGSFELAAVAWDIIHLAWKLEYTLCQTTIHRFKRWELSWLLQGFVASKLQRKKLGHSLGYSAAT